MPIQIIDNFELTSQKPIDNRLVVGPNSFYTNKDDITNKYNGLRIWELPGSNIGSGATNSTPIGLGYVWTGTSWGSENTTASSGGGTTGQLAYFISSNTIQSSNIYFNGANIGIGVAAESVGPVSSRLVVSGNIKSTGRFIGNGSGLTNLYASSLAVPSVGGYMSPALLNPSGAPAPNSIITNNGAGGVWTNPSSITVGTASALQTTRTIWGQPLGGSSNVTGNITLLGSNIVGAGTIGTGTIEVGTVPSGIIYIQPGGQITSNTNLRITTTSVSNIEISGATGGANSILGDIILKPSDRSSGGTSGSDGIIRLERRVRMISENTSTIKFARQDTPINTAASRFFNMSGINNAFVTTFNANTIIPSKTYDRIIQFSSPFGWVGGDSSITNCFISVWIKTLDANTIQPGGVGHNWERIYRNNQNMNGGDFGFLLPSNKIFAIELVCLNTLGTNSSNLTIKERRFGI